MDTGGGRSKTIYVKEVFACRFSVLSLCVKAVRCSSTPTTEYMMCSRPCSFMSSCLCSKEPFTDPLKDTDEVFAAIRTKLSWLFSVFLVL